MSYLGKLYELENKLAITKNKEKRVKEIEEELKIEENIKKFSSEIDEIELSKVGFIKRKDELEREIDELERQLSNVRGALEENKFKTQKELKVAKKTEENLLAKLEELKKNFQFVVSQIKEKEMQVKDIEGRISQLKSRFEAVKKEYELLENEIKEEKPSLEREFEALYATLPQDFVREYKAIREDFPFGAIATVEQGYCGNCGVKLPLEFIEHLRETKGNAILRCEICGKILYLKEE